MGKYNARMLKELYPKNELKKFIGNVENEIYDTKDKLKKQRLKEFLRFLNSKEMQD